MLHRAHTSQLTTPQDKLELIEAAMASTHIPFFMDGRAAARCRGGGACIDGSFL